VPIYLHCDTVKKRIQQKKEKFKNLPSFYSLFNSNTLYYYIIMRQIFVFYGKQQNLLKKIRELPATVSSPLKLREFVDPVLGLGSTLYSPAPARRVLPSNF
jgi:CRISPR/Cas system CSM-associated protein Csm4 (group 5 of RAMP superfamily)